MAVEPSPKRQVPVNTIIVKVDLIGDYRVDVGVSGAKDSRRQSVFHLPYALGQYLLVDYMSRKTTQIHWAQTREEASREAPQKWKTTPVESRKLFWVFPKKPVFKSSA